MKEIFTLPVCELIIFDTEDIITASLSGKEIVVDGVGDEIELPTIGFPTDHITG